ncbi:non-ribosomal peptide synthetase [Paenibacillus sp. ACRRX]|uniref:non-ribosomal peptide synthetase n=1 Tax=Paenibacillus sp. ACRRX TaxID=2918206 RepID=UPI001EF4FB25|nr:non-ribosomal peptide synthetase [Paenibacillus sp. ACRRX]MCG7410806.1 non-ribosomal peptide synthetase [Paenibacillus sp. ACRRX]
MYQTLVELIQSLKEVEDRGITFIHSRAMEVFVSFKELYENALKTLFKLQERGLSPGTELIFQIEDNQDFITVYWACLMGRIIPVPCTVGSNDEQKEKLLRIVGIMHSPFMITTLKRWDDLASYIEKKYSFEKGYNMTEKTIFLDDLVGNTEKGELHFPEPSDIAFIQFSSGSTGIPKGVVLTHHNILVNITDTIEYLKTTSNDCSINWMPLTHDMGLISNHLSSMRAGIQQYIMTPTLFLKRPLLWLEKASEHGVTQLYTTNFALKLIISSYATKKIDEINLSKVRTILIGAEPISAKLCNQFIDDMKGYGLDPLCMLPAYGLAEATVGVAGHELGKPIKVTYINRNSMSIGHKITKTEDSDINSVSFVEIGTCLNNTMIRICDAEGNVLDDQIIGYIQIKGDNVTSGYYNNLVATQEIILDDHWLNTGDLGFVDAGKLTITGRVKDIIIINGQNYYAHDIERIAEGVKGIELNKIVAAGAYNNESQKDELILFVLHRGLLESFVPLSIALKKYINRQIGIEVKHVVPVRSIPKTTSGKLQRFELRDNYLGGNYSEILSQLDTIIGSCEQPPFEPQTPLEKKLHRMWINALEVNAVGMNTPFFEAGGDSIKAIKLIEEINSTFQIDLEVTSLMDGAPTLRSMAYLIEEKESGRTQKVVQDSLQIEFEL